MSAARLIVAGLLAALLLSACGNKGPLVMPKDGTTVAKPKEPKP